MTDTPSSAFTPPMPRLVVPEPEEMIEHIRAAPNETKLMIANTISYGAVKRHVREFAQQTRAKFEERREEAPQVHAKRQVAYQRAYEERQASALAQGVPFTEPYAVEPFVDLTEQAFLDARAGLFMLIGHPLCQFVKEHEMEEFRAHKERLAKDAPKTEPLTHLLFWQREHLATAVLPRFIPPERGVPPYAHLAAQMRVEYPDGALPVLVGMTAGDMYTVVVFVIHDVLTENPRVDSLDTLAPDEMSRCIAW